jgi:hypothetical protein
MGPAVKRKVVLLALKIVELVLQLSQFVAIVFVI